MKMLSDCSGPCETCAIFVSGTTCLAGHGDDDYVPVTTQKAAQIGMNDLTLLLAHREIEMPNDRVLTILKNQMDLLSGSHSDITDLACRINGMLVRGDEMNKEKPNHGCTQISMAKRKFDVLLEELKQHISRAGRVGEEIEAIRSKIRDY